MATRLCMHKKLAQTINQKSSNYSPNLCHQIFFVMVNFYYFKTMFVINTGQQPKLSWKNTSIFHIIFVAEYESEIRFFPSRQNFAVLPISWLPGLKISFSEKTMGDIENLTCYRWFKIKFCAFRKKILKIGSAVLEILAI